MTLICKYYTKQAGDGSMIGPIWEVTQFPRLVLRSEDIFHHFPLDQMRKLIAGTLRCCILSIGLFLSFYHQPFSPSASCFFLMLKNAPENLGRGGRIKGGFALQRFSEAWPTKRPGKLRSAFVPQSDIWVKELLMLKNWKPPWGCMETQEGLKEVMSLWEWWMNRKPKGHHKKGA